MEEAEKSFNEVVDRVRWSWFSLFPRISRVVDAGANGSSIPKGSDNGSNSPSNSVEGGRIINRMSRDFWMPDRSCRMCYECDSPFTVFNRRHHCRICGRVFCRKCTMNTISASADGQGSPGIDDRDRVRVCNFCYKLRQQENPTSGLTLAPPSPLPVSPSTSSANSLFSSTGSSSSMLSSVAPNGPARTSSPSDDVHSLRPAPTISQGAQNDDPATPRPREREQLSSVYSFQNRSEEDEDEEEQKEDADHGLRMSCHTNSEAYEDDSGTDLDLRHLTHNNRPNIYVLQKSDTANYHSEDPAVADVVGNDIASTIGESQGGMISNENSLSKSSLRSYDDIDSLEESVEEASFDSPMYEASYTEGEQLVDYENDEMVWTPPSPEDEDDEIGTCLVDEEDDDDEGGWGLPRSSGSMSSSELRSKDRAASEEQRRAMRAVVDGHFRALVAQLLRGENVQVEDEDGKEGWLGIVTYLALQAANLVKPDTTTGAGMDPGGYVKVKCLASGTRSDSTVIKGVVCKKHVAHKRMASCFKNLRLLLLGGALEYQRVSNQLSSLDTLLQQERDHLNMTVARIEAHHPNVLLVEKTVARFAQDRLLAKGISLVLNVKRPLLERIARCTGAQVVPSPDHLITPKTGHCENFRVEKFFEEHGSAGEGGKKLTKTLMFFEGCPKPLGCTVLLRGSHGDELKKVKRVLQFAVFAAYHLALETSFLADEGATMHDIRSPLSVALPNNATKSERAITSIPGFKLPVAVAATSITHNNQARQEHNPSSTNLLYSQEMSDNMGMQLTSGNHRSTFSNVEALMPAILSPGRQLGALPSPDHPGGSIPSLCAQVKPPVDSFNAYALLKQDATQSLYSVTEGSMETTVQSLPYLPTVQHVSNIQGGEGTGGESFQNNFQSKSNEEYGNLNIDCGHMVEEQQSGKDDFPPTPSDHQSILVSSSSRCLRKGTICEPPHIVRIKYYGNSDKPLGRFLRDTLFDLNYRCRRCDEPADAHVLCYTHRLGSLTISVRHLKPDSHLPGERDGKIWMWHRCLKCVRINGVPPAIRRVIMSDAAWGLSFGKFLELSFSNHAAASRVAACGHSLHRDCLRFYGFGSMIACFRYAPIDLHAVHLPPPKLVFNDLLQQKWLSSEAAEVADKLELVFTEVLNSLRVIAENITGPPSLSMTGNVHEAKKHVADLEVLLLAEKADFEEALEKAAPPLPERGQSCGDILQLNHLRRDLALNASQWDKRLHDLALAVKLKRFEAGSNSNTFRDHLRSSFKNSVSSGSSTSKLSSESQDGEKILAESEVNTAMFARSQSQLSSSNISRSSSFTSPKARKHSSSSSDEAAKELHFSLQEAEDSSESDFSFKPGCPLQSEASLPVTSSLTESRSEFLVEDLLDGKSTILDGSLTNEHPEAYGYNGCASAHLFHENREGNARVASLEEDMRRTLSEGQSPMSLDLFDVGPTMQDKMMARGGETESLNDILDINHSNDRSELISMPNNANISTAEQPEEKNEAFENAAQSTGSISMPKVSEGSEDLESWIGAPFSTLSRGYSRGSLSTQPVSPPMGDGQWNSSSSASLFHVGQVAIQGEAKVLLPPGIDNLVVTVYDDEPTSIIAYAIVSPQYQARITGTQVNKEKHRDREEEPGNLLNSVGTISHPLQSHDGTLETAEPLHSEKSNSSKDTLLLMAGDPKMDSQLLYGDQMHIKVHFTDESQDGKIKYSVTSYYAKQFDVLRKKCCSGDLPFVRSLSRCKKWRAEGGKSKVFFAKTIDDRFIIKQVTRTELLSFLQFAPAYFKYLFEALNSGSPTCLAKILGLHQVTIKQSKAGKDIRMDLMVMENLLYDRHITRLYDLKGSLRSRYNSDSTGKNKVLLDQNLLESMPTAPIFVSNKAKRLLERAVWNDTAFLAYVDVMDYSLLVGVDEEQEELVVGIIDFMRQYTWDKHLETWVKASGILGGPKNATPTVISPKHYKQRFRKAMSTYFVTVPDHWTTPAIATSGSAQGDLVEEGSCTAFEEAREEV